MYTNLKDEIIILLVDWWKNNRCTNAPKNVYQRQIILLDTLRHQDTLLYYT